MTAAEIEMDSESGSGPAGSGSGIGIVVGAVSLVALLSIAAVFFLLVRGNRMRKEQLELQYGGEEEPADPT